ncbi:ATP-dependent helicase [Alicyclobacillus fastidiosus]|uniref:DNA 3'-5' helicase n=1 Tax=Alicyclobacillus fastidiosus TaxID=392011 RepID=A0ABV5ADG5_9BACL|nr:UvrD-helicase domain-containing protein [Alicyclobacillus fastidiosus]WEH08657.1 UvrD-helicase domain-containing protein [Alicyclobacillus fastidiosus]
MGDERLNLLEGLNPEQKQAVQTVSGPLLVVAGAGSGKTSVLTRRIAYLIGEHKVPVHQILAITFTNKAAREMKERIRKFIGARADDLWMGTFHSICVKILRREAEALGYTANFTILDSDDQQALIAQSLLDLNCDLKKFDPRQIGSVISHWKNLMYTTADVKRLPLDESLNEAVAVDVYELYQARLFAANAMDFDDLIIQTVRLLQTDEDVLRRYQEKFRYILIDEYQDTNQAQYQLVQTLAQAHRNLCAVGDADQAIYAWRGADSENMLRFERDYPEATVILLERNYRSTEAILSAANALIANNQKRREKVLRATRGRGKDVGVVCLTDSEQEAGFVAGTIAQHVEDGGSYGDCAVLYRANAQSRVIEEALMGQAIPYTIVGGLTFYDRREIKDIFCYLRVLTNPKDEISLLRIINTPKRGIGEQTVGRFLDHAHEAGITLFEALKYGEAAGASNRASEAARQFHEQLQELMLWMEGMPVSEYLAEVLHATKYRELYLQSGKKEDLQRVENIDELFSVTKSFDKRRGGTVQEFLAEVSLLSDVDKEKEKGKGNVRLMTMHASKGLEFPVVFLIGMEEGLFPHPRSMDDEQAVEEERNLCYVGMTRAMDQLYMTYAVERTLFGHVTNRDPSRFLSELPDDWVNKVDLAVQHNLAISPGMHVRHVQHGEGIVLHVAAGKDGGDDQVQVMFHPSVGMKWIAKNLLRPKEESVVQ